MDLPICSQIPHRGSRKEGILEAWFSEAPNKELAVSSGDGRGLLLFHFNEQFWRSPSGKVKSCYDLQKATPVETQNEQGGQTFTLFFVENIRKNLTRRGIERRRLANKRPAAIQALMTINKSNLEIQRDLQSAFTKIAHEHK
jgi:hypothetical protein